MNESIPYCLGGNQESIHISDCRGANKPLPEVPVKAPSETDIAIAKRIIEEIEDGACLQLGTGGQLDFIFWAFGSKGGKGIIGLSSTYKDKEGNVHSRIVPTLKPWSASPILTLEKTRFHRPKR